MKVKVKHISITETNIMGQQVFRYLHRYVSWSSYIHLDFIVIVMLTQHHFLQLFKELFDPVLNEQHRGFSPADKHPAPELDPSKVTYILKR